jgi:7-carboxy-7-deazaguanine synthase
MRCPGWPCDTQFAIDPANKESWIKKEALEVFDAIDDYPKHVCLTGGEPLIQRAEQMKDLVKELRAYNYQIDLFTNGSQPLPIWAMEPDVTVVMDWKLPGSGEGSTGLTQRLMNMNFLSAKDAVKFVVKDTADLHTALDVYRNHRGNQHRWYVGRAWGDIEDADIVQFIIDYKLPWYLNVQQHKYIWDPNKRGV